MIAAGATAVTAAAAAALVVTVAAPAAAPHTLASATAGPSSRATAGSSHPSRATLAAWTVTKMDNGTLKITIREMRDPSALQATLRADGARVVVTDSLGSPAGKTAGPSRTQLRRGRGLRGGLGRRKPSRPLLPG